MVTPLPQISSAAWEHPTDRAALAALQTIPGFDSVLRKVVGMFGERNIRINYQAQALRVGPSQYSDIHRLLREVADVFDTDVPPLFISQTPLVNAGAVGVDNPFIVLNSSLIELSTPDQLRFTLGHEIAHILSDHALYRTLPLPAARLRTTTRAGRWAGGDTDHTCASRMAPKVRGVV